ncbi:MAG: hypothetical protein IKS20_11345, partial [Victivallales bacterium]|nr:hypothetical protein [Victivallales bacterium]
LTNLVIFSVPPRMTEQPVFGKPKPAINYVFLRITMPFIQSQAVNAYQQTLFRCCVSKELTHSVLGGTVASWMGIDLPSASNVNGLTTPWDRTQLDANPEYDPLKGHK